MSYKALVRVVIQMGAYIWLVQLFARSYSISGNADMLVQKLGSTIIEQWFFLLGLISASLLWMRVERQSRFKWQRVVALSPLMAICTVSIVIAHIAISGMTNSVVEYALLMFMFGIGGVAIHLWYLTLPAIALYIGYFMLTYWSKIQRLFE